MNEFFGTVISEGIAIGKVAKYFKNNAINKNNIFENNKENQINIFNEAVSELKTKLTEIHKEYSSKKETELAEIIDIQLIVLEDPEFYAEIISKIEEQNTAIDAIKIVSEKLLADFNAIEDSYFSQRAKDIEDISNQLIAKINKSEDIINLHDDTIIIAEDIATNKLLELPRNKIAAVIVTKASFNSHLSILLRMLEIPAINVEDKNILEIEDGKNIIVDCSNLKVIVDIDEKNYLQEKEKINKLNLTKKQSLEKYKYKETISKDGKKINLYANIGSLEDTDLAIASGAEGVGLLRTEFICNNKKQCPSEKEQEEIYFNIAQKLNGKALTIRTFDFGSDKKVDFIEFAKEENPALGLRAIRICLQNKDLFLTQLRAIYKAAIRINKIFPNPISIMFPMITSSWEVEDCIKICKEIEKELNLNFKINLGLMIETPAAIFIADKIAKYVDFFSVGTNDLIQYTYAIDRQSGELASYFKELDYSPICEMLKILSSVAKNNNINLKICGEMAADKRFTKFLLENGFNEFSVNSNKILEIRKTICEI